MRENRFDEKLNPRRLPSLFDLQLRDDLIERRGYLLGVVPIQNEPNVVCGATQMNDIPFCLWLVAMKSQAERRIGKLKILGGITPSCLQKLLDSQQNRNVGKPE